MQLILLWFFMKETFETSVEVGELSKLSLDDSLEYIETREYKPAPVKEWKPNEDVKTTQAPRVVREAKVLKKKGRDGKQILTQMYGQ